MSHTARRPKGFMRWISAVALTGATVALLSGCVPPDAISVRLISGALNFVVCDTPFTKVTVDASPKDAKPYVSHDMWIASGTLTRDQGPHEYGVPPAGMTSEIEPAPLTLEGNFVGVYVEQLDDSGMSGDGAYGAFDGDEISADYWLTAGNARWDSPCQP